MDSGGLSRWGELGEQVAVGVEGLGFQLVPDSQVVLSGEPTPAPHVDGRVGFESQSVLQRLDRSEQVNCLVSQQCVHARIVTTVTPIVNMVTPAAYKVPDMPYKSLSERAKMARLRAGFATEAAAAKAIGCSRPAVISWENGGSKSIGTANLMHAARAYRVSPAWLAMQSDDDGFPWSPGDEIPVSQAVSSQREMLSAAMKLVHLVRDRSFAPLSQDEQARVERAAVDVVMEVGARAILDEGRIESAYGQVVEKARSGGQ